MSAPPLNPQVSAAVCAPGVDMYAAARLLAMYAGPVRFAHTDSLALALRDIFAVLPRDNLGAAVTLESACLGLTGAVSPLPAETLAALQTTLGSDEGQDLAQWVQGVQDRMLALLHRGINHAEPRRAFTMAHTDVWSTLLGSWTAQQEGSLPLQARLRLFAPLSRGPCSDHDLRWAVKAVLAQHGVETSVTVTPLQGGAVRRPPATWSRLGESQASLGGALTLGTSSCILAHANTVTLGPLDAAMAQHLDRVADGLQVALYAVLRAALPLTRHTRVRLSFAAAAAAPLQLGAALGDTCAPRSMGLGRAMFGAATHDYSIDWFNTHEDQAA